MNKRLTVGMQLAAGIFAAAALAPPVVADEYQFLVSGYPAANASNSATSSGIALETGTLAATVANDAPLELRYLTSDESDGIALRTDAALAFTIVLR